VPRDVAAAHHAHRLSTDLGRTYRYPARVSVTLQRRRSEELPKEIRDIAWKVQVRLCGRFRRLAAKGKKTHVIVAAIAREMAAFLWAIGQHVTPAVWSSVRGSAMIKIIARATFVQTALESATAMPRELFSCWSCRRALCRAGARRLSTAICQSQTPRRALYSLLHRREAGAAFRAEGSGTLRAAGRRGCLLAGDSNR
jgi:hypothetical protein